MIEDMIGFRACLIAAGISGLVATAAPAIAQTPAPATPTSRPLPCSSATTTAQREAVAAAETLLDASWLARDGARVTAFRTKPEAVNPFALRDPKTEPPKPPITGFVHAEAVGCALSERDGASEVVFLGLGVRFHEDGKWSGRLPQGLLLSVVVRHVDGVAKAVAKPEAPTVILPDAILRRPDATEIPPLPRATTAKSKKK